MSPRVTYWTGTWDPACEAHSIEIEHLRKSHRPNSLVVACSPGQSTKLFLRDRVIRLSDRYWMVFRALQHALEPMGDITHVFGSLGAWHLARSLGSRPMVFTVTLAERPSYPSLYEKVTCFAAETEEIANMLRSDGIPDDRIRIVYPGVDLSRFIPVQPPPMKPFRLLYASSPTHSGEFEARGIPLLVELARRLPDIQIICLWRPWDGIEASRKALLELHPPPNFEVVRRIVPDMSVIYRDVHATVVPFAPGFGKSCPNSVVEGLACGRPTIVSESCGVSQLVHRSGAGLCVPRTVDEFAAAVERLRNFFEIFSTAARELAERTFDLNSFCRRYSNLYKELLR